MSAPVARHGEDQVISVVNAETEFSRVCFLWFDAAKLPGREPVPAGGVQDAAHVPVFVDEGDASVGTA